MSGPRRIGPWVVDRELGRGGMGVVFEAHHEGSGERVALKVILDGGDALGPERERFVREARTVASLEHPGIVRLRDQGVAEGRVFFAMELVGGHSLTTLLERGDLSRAERLDVVRQVAEAIAYAHERGVIHRDLKPANVLLVREPRDDRSRFHAKVVDFGLARGQGDERLTETGDVLGTLAYMAPEQASGERGAVGPPADVYSLGAILFEAVAGRTVFAGDGAQLMKQVLLDRAPSLRTLDATVPAALDALVARILEKDPARRPRAAAVARALASPELGAAKRVRLRRPVAAVAIGALAALAGTGAVLLATPRSKPATRIEPRRSPPPGPVSSPAPARAARAPSREDQARAETIAQSARDLYDEMDPTTTERVKADVAEALAADPGCGLALALRGVMRIDAEPGSAEGHEDLERAAPLCPADPLPWFKLGLARREKGDLAGALLAVEKATDILPTLFQGHANAARLLVDLGREAEAEERLARIESSRGDGSDVRVIRARLLARRGDRAGALAHLDVALARAGRPIPEASALRSEVRLAAGDLEGALADANVAVRHGAKSARPWHARSRVREARGELAGALDDAKEAVRRSRDPVYAEHAARLREDPRLREVAASSREPAARAAADELAREAWSRYGTADVAGAGEKAREALGRDPTDPSARALDAILRFAANEDVVRALSDLEAVAPEVPEIPHAQYYLGYARRIRRRHAEALAQVDAALKLAPGEVLYVIERGLVLIELDRLDEAEAQARRALELRREAPRALELLARIRARRGEREGAIADLTRLIESRPPHSPWPSAFHHRAELRLEGGDAAGALEDATRAIEGGSNIARFWHLRSRARDALGQREEALADAIQADELGQGDPVFAKHRADLRAKADR